MLVTILLSTRVMGWVFEALRLVPSCPLPWLGQNWGVTIRVCVQAGAESRSPSGWRCPGAVKRGGSGFGGLGKDSPVSLPSYELHYSEDREREQGLEAEEGLMSARISRLRRSWCLRRSWGPQKRHYQLTRG